MKTMMKPKHLLLGIILLAHSTMRSDMVGPFMISNNLLPLTLSTSGQIYALSGNVTGNITISANDVTLNLNEHVISGRIIISGQRALVYGGTVIAPAPADNATADLGVIQINASAGNAQILDCFIAAADGTVATVRGARGMQIDADDVIVRRCVVQAGNGGPNNGVSNGGTALQGAGNRMIIDQCELFGGDGSNSTTAATDMASGGLGLYITGGDSAQILSSLIIAGNSGNLSAGGTPIVGPRTFADGGPNRCDGTNVLIRNCKIYGGAANLISTTSSINTNVITGGNGGAGLILASPNASCTLENSEIIGGGGVAYTVGSAVDSGAGDLLTQGSGGHGLSITGANTRVVARDSIMTGGSAGALTATGNIGNVLAGSGGAGVSIDSQTAIVTIANAIMTGGNATRITSGGSIGVVAFPERGSGGAGITSHALDLLVTNSSMTGGDIPLTTATTIGTSLVNAAVDMREGGDGAQAMFDCGRSQFEECLMRGGTCGGLLATTINGISSSIGRGGHGVYIEHLPSTSKLVQTNLDRCDIYGGRAGDWTSTGAMGLLSSVRGTPAGNAIHAIYDDINVTNCTMTTFRGADLLVGAASGARTAGSSGHGVYIFVGLNVTVRNCAVLEIERGGNAAGALGTGGDSGSGAFVAGASVTGEISNCTFANIAAGGTGGAGNGVAGFAIFNGPGAAGIMIIGNFAHSIASVTKYILGPVATHVDLLASGTNFLDLVSVPNSAHRLTNVYKV